MSRDNPSNSDDIIDVRSVIDRVEELNDEIEDAEDRAKAGVTFDSEHRHYEDPLTAPGPWMAPDGSHHDTEDDAQDAALTELREELSDEYEERDGLTELLDDLSGYGGDHQWRGDWYPVTLIRDSYFEDYAREFAEDIGAIKSDLGWPYGCIDWERAANELQTDYSSVEFDGVTYWYR